MSGRNVRYRHHDAMSRISWQEFERLLATYYRGQGYAVEHVGTAATSARYDGGIDLKLRRNHEYILVQCKHWNAWQVAHNDVHQLLGLMVNEGATGAILITSGEFTRAAIDAAQRQGHVQLVDGAALRAMVGPLPELEPPPASAFDTETHPVQSPPRSDSSRPMPGADTARTVASSVGARLLNAVEDRIRYGTGRPSRRSRSGNETLVRLIIGILATGLLLVFLQNSMSRITRNINNIGQPAAPRAAPAALPAPIASQGQVTAMPSVSPAQPSQVETVAPRIHQEMTEAELREWKRGNAESMKLLEATTPEM